MTFGPSRPALGYTMRQLRSQHFGTFPSSFNLHPCTWLWSPGPWGPACWWWRRPLGRGRVRGGVAAVLDPGQPRSGRQRPCQMSGSRWRALRRRPGGSHQGRGAGRYPDPGEASWPRCWAEQMGWGRSGWEEWRGWGRRERAEDQTSRGVEGTWTLGERGREKRRNERRITNGGGWGGLCQPLSGG